MKNWNEYKAAAIREIIRRALEDEELFERDANTPQDVREFLARPGEGGEKALADGEVLLALQALAVRFEHGDVNVLRDCDGGMV